MSHINHPPPTIEYVLLGMLYQNPAHGYDIYKKIHDMESLSLIWQVKRSKLYYLLEKLEKQKLLEATYIPVENRPDRKQYRLTEKGQNAFLAWIETPVEVARHVRLLILARLHFALQIGQEIALNLIKKQRAQCQTWIESMQAQLDALENPDFIIQQAFSFRIGQIQAMQDWLDECETRLQTP